MAHKRMLQAPFQGMPFLWNIDAKVGTQVSEPNSSDDVALVQLLFLIAPPNMGSSATGGCRARPNISGQVDHATGFWIYFAQVEAGGTFKADGNLSPMSGAANNERLIVRLNLNAMKGNRTAWENLPNHPQCPPALKAKLLAPPRNN